MTANYRELVSICRQFNRFRVAGSLVDHFWERGHSARLRPGMAALHQQKVRAPIGFGLDANLLEP